MVIDPLTKLHVIAVFSLFLKITFFRKIFPQAIPESTFVVTNRVEDTRLIEIQPGSRFKIKLELTFHAFYTITVELAIATVSLVILIKELSFY